MAQVRQVVSESLQATIRRLLPSQQGFTEDLQASNVITPIIDLTPTAEGSLLPRDLQNALAFGSQTAFECRNNTVTILNTAGFYRVFGSFYTLSGSGSPRIVSVSLSDGFSSKIILEFENSPNSTNTSNWEQVDFTVFLDSGESMTATSNINEAVFIGSTRQIADINGNLVNPSGFSSS